MAQPRRLVGEQPECRSVRLREAETREAGELVVHQVRRLRVDPVPRRAFDEAVAIGLDRLMAALAAHRPPEALGLADREARQRHRHLEHLVLEDDDAERVLEWLRKQWMVDRRDELRILAQLL